MVAPLFNIAARVEIRTTPPIVIDNTDGNGLRVDWLVDKSRCSQPDHATITAYNLPPAARLAISAALARSLVPTWPWPIPVAIPLLVTLFVGWGGAPELLFTGQVWHATPERLTGTDVLTMLEAGDGVEPLRDTPPAGGAEFGIGVQLAVAKILGELGIQPAGTALAAIAEASAQVPAAQNFQFVSDGDPRDLLDQLMASIRLSWGVHDGHFVVYRAGLRNDVLPSILTPTSGLLQWDEADEGVEFEALAQPRVAPGVQVQILDERNVSVGGGPLRVEQVSFVGSTVGPSTMSGTARKVALL